MSLLDFILFSLEHHSSLCHLDTHKCRWHQRTSNRRDGSGEVEPDGRGEGEADEGEAEGSGGTLNVANSGEVHIHILMKLIY